MKKRIQRLALSSLFVLTVGTIGAIVAEVSLGRAYAPACTKCDERLGCKGSTCECPRGSNYGDPCTPPSQ
jgi:hypothetical protein